MTGTDVRRFFVLPAALVLLGSMLGSVCEDETIVEVERPFFDDPPAMAAGFLGYDEQVVNLTTCGNCHVGQQAEWEDTHHAEAWDAMQNSGIAEESCEVCHSTGPNGNLTDTGGLVATGDARYQDVQCEACHGPGETHVNFPDNTGPLASIKVGTELTSGCGECHRASSGAHNPFVEEWSLSQHGEGAHRPQYRQRETCRNCHGAQGALLAWGVNDVFIEKDTGEEIGIVCAVCHDPHDGTNIGQTRFALDARDVDTNLCMKCHQRRAVPDEDNPQRGPHSPQGPLLLGENVGWIPPNFQYDEGSIVATHGTERNPKLCATCHVHQLEFTDPATGLQITGSGHLFEPIPCLDPTGFPTNADECDVQERSFDACTAAGCHGTEDAARSAYTLAKDRIARLVEELDSLLEQVPASEFDRNDGIFTVAEGANFNAGLGDIRSSPIHNPFLTEALLVASMDAVEEEYGVMNSLGVVDWDARLQAIKSRVGR
jgi:predicted CXXCH cytochrome family protein